MTAQLVRALISLPGPASCPAVPCPQPRRAVLFDQDVLHRLSPPTRAAGGRPRYSLVWCVTLHAQLYIRLWPTLYTAASTAPAVCLQLVVFDRASSEDSLH